MIPTFPDEVTEAQKDSVTCPGTHMVAPGFEHLSLWRPSLSQSPPQCYYLLMKLVEAHRTAGSQGWDRWDGVTGLHDGMRGRGWGQTSGLGLIVHSGFSLGWRIYSNLLLGEQWWWRAGYRGAQCKPTFLGLWVKPSSKECFPRSLCGLWLGPVSGANPGSLRQVQKNSQFSAGRADRCPGWRGAFESGHLS